MTDQPAEASSAGTDPEPLDESEGLLYHQVHPNFVSRGVPARRGFQPNSTDNGEMSVDRSTRSSPKESYDRYTSGPLKSAGTWGFETKVVIAAGSNAFPQEVPGNPAHGFVDFRGMDKNAVDALSAILKNDAVQRGCLYKPEEPGS